MQIDLLAGLLADIQPEPRPARAVPSTLLHEHFTVTADSRRVTISAPEQRVAERPFQPVAERPLLPAVRHTFAWLGLRRLFQLWEGCEPLGAHPLAPWLDRIVAAVAPTEELVLEVAPWCVSWTRVTVRSLWTGLDRADVLRHAESTGCDTRQQALARADAVAARLRARGRVVVIRDLTPEDMPEAPVRYIGATKEVRLGNLVLTLPAEIRV